MSCNNIQNISGFSSSLYPSQETANKGSITFKLVSDHLKNQKLEEAFTLISHSLQDSDLQTTARCIDAILLKAKETKNLTFIEKVIDDFLSGDKKLDAIVDLIQSYLDEENRSAAKKICTKYLVDIQKANQGHHIEKLVKLLLILQHYEAATNLTVQHQEQYPSVRSVFNDTLHQDEQKVSSK
jgi:hypothetical protein